MKDYEDEAFEKWWNSLASKWEHPDTKVAAWQAWQFISQSQPEQEPVAHCTVRPLRGDEAYPKTEIIWVKGRPVAGPLYTTPPQCTWVGLDKEDREQHRNDWLSNIHDKEFFATEAKLKEKNNG